MFKKDKWLWNLIILTVMRPHTDYDEYELVPSTYKECGCGGIMSGNCTGNCNAAMHFGYFKKRSPEEIAKIKEARKIKEEDEIIAKSAAIQAERNERKLKLNAQEAEILNILNHVSLPGSLVRDNIYMKNLIDKGLAAYSVSSDYYFLTSPGYYQFKQFCR